MPIDDWTSLPYNHIKDWTPLSNNQVPDPKSFEQDDGLLSSLYNLPNTIKSKLDTLLGGSLSAKEDIQGLSNRMRIEAIGTPNAAQIQANDPSIVKKIARTGVDTIANVAKGQLGVQPNPDESPIAKFANKIAQPNREPDPYLSSLNQGTGLDDNQLQGGLPWLEATEGKPIYRGSPRYHEKLDPGKYDTGDVLGWMTHGATEPEYASDYAMGKAKHSTPYLNSGDRPHIDLIKADAKNVLDLVDPNPDDIAQAIAQMTPGARAAQIAQWKFARRNPEKAKLALSSLHYPNPELIPDNEVPVRTIADKLYLNPEQWKNSPFDAVKYRDMGHESWAIPPETQVRGFWSNEPLTDVPKPIKIIKQPNDSPIAPSESSLTKYFKGPGKDLPVGLEDAYDLYKNPQPWELPEDVKQGLQLPWNPNEGKQAEDYLGQKVKIIPYHGGHPGMMTVNESNLKDLEHHLNMGSTIDPIDHWGVPKSQQFDKFKDDDMFSNYFKEESLNKPKKLQSDYEDQFNKIHYGDEPLADPNKMYSNSKMKWMIDAADKFGINYHKLKDYNTLEKVLNDHPVDVPKMGKLTKTEASQLASAGELSWTVFDKYFPW